MKFSIITPTYNSSSTLQETLRSIAGQSYQDKEHIIIDGGSTDETLAMIRAYADGNASVRVLSEKDQGLYHAMNKGIALATGDIIHILNSDDFYADDTVLEKVATAFADPAINACYGDLVLVDRSDISKITRVWRAGKFDAKRIASGWSPPHPALFVRKDRYQAVGDFFLGFKIASDYDFMLRLMLSDQTHFAYIPQVLVYMRNFGMSGNSIRQRLKGWSELKQSWRRNGHVPPNCFFLRRTLSKLPQYFLAHK